MTPPTIPPALDPAVLDELRALDSEDPEGVLAEALDAYATDAPQRLVRMLEASCRGDLEDVAAEAHALKGASLTVGANAAAHACAALESGASRGTPEAVAIADAEVNRALAAIRELLGRREAEDAGRSPRG